MENQGPANLVESPEDHLKRLSILSDELQRRTDVEQSAQLDAATVTLLILPFLIFFSSINPDAPNILPIRANLSGLSSPS